MFVPVDAVNKFQLILQEVMYSAVFPKWGMIGADCHFGTVLMKK
jgi:hypothetical protein